MFRLSLCHWLPLNHASIPEPMTEGDKLEHKDWLKPIRPLPQRMKVGMGPDPAKCEAGTQW